MSLQACCPACEGVDLFVVTLVPKDREMVFSTCRTCENRWWQDAAEAEADVSLDDVLQDLAS